MTLARRISLPLLLTASMVAVPAAAYSQITDAPAPGVYPSYTGRNSVAFDPVNDVYMAVVWNPPFGSILTGRFLNKAGNPIGGDFVIAVDDVDGEGNPAYASWASIAAGGPPNDPAFLVTYSVTLDGSTAIRYARLVRYVNGVPSVSPRAVVADLGGQWFAAEKAQSVWNGQQFVVGTRVHVPGQSFPSPQVNLVDMNLNVSSPVNLGDGADFYGSPAIACGSVGVCLTVGFKAGIPGGYSGGTYGRIFSATTLAPQGSSMLLVSPLGQNEDQAVVYQKHTGLFLTHWFRVAGGYIETRLVVPDGTMGTTNTAAGPNAGMNTFSYNQFTQTTLLTFKDSEATLYAWELGDQGTPIRPTNFLTLTGWDGAINDYLPAMAANEEDGQWLLTYRKAASSFGVIVTGTYVDPASVPLTIQTSGTLLPATHTLPFTQLLLASGGVIPYTWTQVSGELPPGINLNGPYLSGTPTLPGNYSFRLRVTSTDLQVAERDFTLDVQAIISVPPGIVGSHITGGTPMWMTPNLGERNNLAFDPVNGVYLMTVDRGPNPLIGRFLNRNGLPIGADFLIADDVDPNTGSLGHLAWAGITFGGPPGDPVFLVTYILADQGLNPKYARLVRYVPGGTPTVSARARINDVRGEWLAAEKAQSYWTGSHFVVGTRILMPGQSLPSPTVNSIDLNLTVSPTVNLGDGQDFYGSPSMACAANGVCIVVGFKAGIPTGYSGGTYARRFQGADLAPLGTFVTLAGGNPNEDQGVVYQAHTGNFLAQWSRGVGPGYTDTRLIGTDGAMSLFDLAKGFAPGSGASVIAYNAATRTSLLVTKRLDAALIAMELGDDGYPLDPTNTVVVTGWDGSINDFYPSIAANGTDRQWLVTARLASGTHGKVIQGSPYGTPYALQNGSFSGGLTGWQLFALPSSGDLVANVNNGVLEFYRLPQPPGVGQGVVFQSLGVGLGADVPINAEFDLGNSSTVRKRLTVLLHDLDFSDLQMCTFWLEPGAPLRKYRIQTHTTKAWTNATVSFYLASTGSDGGAYLLDKVQVYTVAGQVVDRTDCFDPTTPDPQPFPDGGNMLVNGDFGAGLSPWNTFGQITWQITAGVFEFARPAGTPAGVVLQPTLIAVPALTRLTATMALGNSSGVRRRVTVIVHDSDFTDLAACTFWLAPGQPLSTYRVKAYAGRTWNNATVSVYPSAVNTTPWILLDDVMLQVTHSAPLVGTECVEPAEALTSAIESRVTQGATTAPVPLMSEWGRVAADIGWVAAVTETGAQAFVLPAPIDLTSATAAILRFDARLRVDDPIAYVEVTRDGLTWTRLTEIPATGDWTTMAVDLGEFVGDALYVRFVYAGGAIRNVDVEIRSAGSRRIPLPGSR